MRKTFLLTMIISRLPAAWSFDPNPRLSGLPDNTAVDLGAYDCVTRPGEYGCAGIFDYGSIVYNPLNHQILAWGGGHGASMRTDVDVFDFRSLRWTHADYDSSITCSAMGGQYFRDGLPVPPSDGFLPAAYDVALDAWSWNGEKYPVVQHAYDLVVISTITRELVVVRIPGGLNTNVLCADVDVSYNGGAGTGSPIPHYDLESRTWSFSSIGSGRDYTSTSWDKYPTAEYDPLSNNVIIIGDARGTWRYDPLNQVKQKIGTGTIGGAAQNLIYYPPADVFYAISTVYVPAGFQMAELALDRSRWTSTVTPLTLNGAPGSYRMTGPLPASSSEEDFQGQNAETGFAYDPVNRIIGGAIRDGYFYAFHPQDRRWERIQMASAPGSGPVGTQRFHAIAFDPVDGVFLFMDDRYHTWAYRYKQGTLPETPDIPPDRPRRLRNR